MTKVSTSISIDDWKLKRIKAMKLSTTRIVERAIDAVVTGEMEDVAVSSQLSMIDDEIEALQENIFAMEHRLVSSRARLHSLREKRHQIETEWELVKRTSRVAGVTRKLNYIIIAAKYHIPTIKEASEDVVKELKELNPDFDLEAHISRFRLIMDS